MCVYIYIHITHTNVCLFARARAYRGLYTYIRFCALVCLCISRMQVMQHLDGEGCARVATLLGEMVNSHETTFTTALVILQTALGEELGDTFDQVASILCGVCYEQEMTPSVESH
jgi:hypothetical protein